jgi:hypothetical protein
MQKFILIETVILFQQFKQFQIFKIFFYNLNDLIIRDIMRYNINIKYHVYYKLL